MAGDLGDLDALLAGIQRQTQQRALARTTEAQRLADAVLAEAETQAEALVESALAEADKRASALEQRLSAHSELEAKRWWLRAREELLEGVFAQAETKLISLVEGADYPAVLERLAARAAGALEGSVITLQADARGHALLTPERLEAWGRDGTVFERAEQPADGWGGLIASCGRERFDHGFRGRLAEARDVLRETVFEVLIGGSGERAG